MMTLFKLKMDWVLPRFLIFVNQAFAIDSLVQIKPTYAVNLQSSYKQLCIEIGINQIIELSARNEFICLGFAQVGYREIKCCPFHILNFNIEKKMFLFNLR